VVVLPVIPPPRPLISRVGQLAPQRFAGIAEKLQSPYEDRRPGKTGQPHIEVALECRPIRSDE